MRSISAKRRKKRRERKIKSGGFEVSNFRGGDLVQFETNTKRKLRDLETQKFRFQGTTTFFRRTSQNLSISLRSFEIFFSQSGQRRKLKLLLAYTLSCSIMRYPHQEVSFSPLSPCLFGFQRRKKMLYCIRFSIS